MRAVRCSAVFLDAAREVNKVRAAREGDRFENCDPELMLLRLFQRFVPHATQVFHGNHSTKHSIHMNDYAMEKAFVYGLFFISRRLGSKYSPAGLHPALSIRANCPPVMPIARGGGSPAAPAMPITLEGGLPAAPSAAANAARPARSSWET